MTRRRAILKFCQFVGASPLLKADRKYSELSDPLSSWRTSSTSLSWPRRNWITGVGLHGGGSDDEASLRANRTDFDHILIRPHFLLNDVSTIDTSTTLFGKKLTQRFIFDNRRQELLYSQWRRGTAQAAGTSNSMMITGGGINQILAAGKGPKVWWQFTTAAEFRTKNQMADFAERLEDQGCSGISVTVDIYHVPAASAASTTAGAQLVPASQRGPPE